MAMLKGGGPGGGHNRFRGSFNTRHLTFYHAEGNVSDP